MKEKVLSVKDLHISFKTDRGIVKAVRGVSFDLYKGETLCIVGESGSGKSVTNKAIMGISAKNAIIENGSIMYEGEDLTKVSEEEFHRIRGHKIGMIFQDPLSALNPVMKIGKQIIEATMVNRNILKKKYEDLISYDLIQFRNNKSNTLFNINKLDELINKNEAYLKLKKDNAKKISLTNKKIEFIDKTKFKKKEEKIQELSDFIKKTQENEIESSNALREVIHEFFKNNDSDIVKEKELIKKYESKNEFTSEVYKKINEVKLEAHKMTLAAIENKDFLNFDYEKFEDSLINLNKKLIELKKIYKAEYKLKKAPLKEALSLKKKEAKKEVDLYHKELKLAHEKKIKELEDELKEVKIKKEELLASLPAEEKEKLLADLKFNEELKKKEEKNRLKNKEMNLSKVEKKESQEREILNKDFLALLNKEDKLNKAIEEEKQDFINKTRVTKAEAKRMALEVMKEVGIPLPEKRFKQYPFEFSGGMRQRIVIAIALTANPDILICDEPTTALDVTIQAQILDLINNLKAKRNLSCIFITHDLGVVAHMADRVAVMYAGTIVEYGLANEIFFDPKHPYTWALLSSIPDINSKEKLEAIPGTPPDMLFPPKGDAFALRSKYAMEIDFKYRPPFFKVSDTHYAATWLLCKGAPHVEMPKIVSSRIANAKKAIEEGEENV